MCPACPTCPAILISSVFFKDVLSVQLYCLKTEEMTARKTDDIILLGRVGPVGPETGSKRYNLCCVICLRIEHDASGPCAVRELYFGFSVSGGFNGYLAVSCSPGKVTVQAELVFTESVLQESWDDRVCGATTISGLDTIDDTRAVRESRLICGNPTTHKFVCSGTCIYGWTMR